MNFFQQLSELSPNLDLSFRIMSKNGKITLSALPHVKETIIKPLVVTGTPQELDEGLIEKLKPVIESAAGLQVQAEMEVEEEEKEEKPAAKKQDTQKKEAAKKPAKKSAKPKPDKKESAKPKAEPEKPKVQEQSIF